jgi:hypothetical protein
MAHDHQVTAVADPAPLAVHLMAETIWLADRLALPENFRG